MLDLNAAVPGASVRPHHPDERLALLGDDNVAHRPEKIHVREERSARCADRRIDRLGQKVKRDCVSSHAISLVRAE
jgi:hypothetical protein